MWKIGWTLMTSPSKLRPHSWKGYIKLEPLCYLWLHLVLFFMSCASVFVRQRIAGLTKLIVVRQCNSLWVNNSSGEEFKWHFHHFRHPLLARFTVSITDMTMVMMRMMISGSCGWWTVIKRSPNWWWGLVFKERWQHWGWQREGKRHPAYNCLLHSSRRFSPTFLPFHPLLLLPSIRGWF